MTVRNLSVDRLARWMATGVTTAGLSIAIIPLAHSGLIPARKDRPAAAEQSLLAPRPNASATPAVRQSDAAINVVGLRRQPPRQAVVIAPQAAAQPVAAPVYVPQPLYYPAGPPATQTPQQYNALQQQMTGQDNSAVSRELQRLYEESGRQAPQMPGMAPQPAPAPVPQYAPQAGYAPQPGYAIPPGYVAAPGYAPPGYAPPGYAPQPGYVPQPGYAPQAGYAPPAGYYPQPGYVPAPGYAPQAAPMQVPVSQPISTEPDEDPEFFPGEGLADKELGGLEFDESPGQPRTSGPTLTPMVRPQQSFVAIPPQQQQPQPPAGYGFAYPGPAAQQQPTPIITAGIVPPNVDPPAAAIELPDAEELIVGAPVETDYEMSADPKIAKKGFLGRFGSSAPVAQKPPVEPNPYVPNPNAQLLANSDDLPLAPSADVPGPEQDPAMAEIARFANPETPIVPLVVEELPPPVVTPSVRTLPVAAAVTVGSAARAKTQASELFKDEEPAPVETPKVEATVVEAPIIKPAPLRRGGIAAGGFAPGKNVVPEQPAPAAVEQSVVATPIPAAAPADPIVTRELADSAAPAAKIESTSPYTGRSLEETPAEPAAPVAAREHRGMFFPPVAVEASGDSADFVDPVPLPLPVPLPEPAEIAPPALISTNVQPVSEAPMAPANVPERSTYTQSKYEQIASRKGVQGLKGFCPVRLRDHRDLADGQPQFRVQHSGRVYALSSAEALQTFLADPEKYTPAGNGYDVVIHQQSGEAVEGVLDNSAWFKGRLYLFTSAENKDTFVANPTTYSMK